MACTTRQLASLRCTAPQPRPFATAGAKRIAVDLSGVRETAPLTTLAAYGQIGEIAARAALVEPEPAMTGVFRAVNKVIPVQVVNVPFRAGADKTSGDDLAALEAAMSVEGLAVDQTPRALAFITTGLFLGNFA
jgi:hypothetical protein